MSIPISSDVIKGAEDIIAHSETAVEHVIHSVEHADVVYRLGVDVGGTNTDAVLLALSEDHKQNAVLSGHKSPTTPEVMDGIVSAVQMVLKDVSDLSKIQALSIGTTHFVNALITRDPRKLHKVAVIRLCGPFSLKCPPFASFPRELRSILKGPVFMLSGGLQIDGREIAPVIPAEVEAACKEIAAANIHAIAISSVYAPIDHTYKQEEAVASIVRRLLPRAHITISKQISNIGLLDRENASILNAALLSYARQTVRGFRRAAALLNLSCPVFITGNDGTLLTCAQAAKFPIRTFSSGPTNSMRGAAWLAQLEMGQEKGEGALVVDIGGTTSDIGMLLPTGFPRQAAAKHHLCGVRLNFSMPDVVSIGLGGGSLVRTHPEDGRVSVGPDSVGYRITSEALVFGGKVLTATDIAVASGRVGDVGDKSLVKHVLKGMVEKAQARIKSMLETTLDSMKTSAADIPVYLVGGGAILAPDHLDGVSRVVKFKNSGVANACGAAIAQVAGTVDTVEEISSRSIPEVRKLIEHRAMDLAIKAGANPDKVSIIESEAIPIAYTAGRCRFYVKAAGEWKGVTGEAEEVGEEDEDGEAGTLVNGAYEPEEPEHVPTAKEIVDYRPRVEQGAWTLSELDLEFIADGAYILGCGGGGSPYQRYLRLREGLRKGAVIRVIDLGSLEDDALIGWGGGLGSPEVADERLSGDEYQEATEELLKFMGITKLAGFAALEIGGGNGMINMILSSSEVFGWPVIDGDFMGRAYPTSWQTTPNVYDDTHKCANLLPSAIASGDGNVMFMTRVKGDRDHDAAFRACCTEMGTSVGCALRPLTAGYCRKAMINNTVSLAWRIGRAVALARKSAQIGNVGNIIVDALGGKETGRVLFSGKIVDVSRSIYKGHTIGRVTIQALADDSEPTDGPVEKYKGTLMIPFKNENLYAEHDPKDGSKPIVLASVPDLIMVIDAQNGAALGTPDYKYGLRVIVLGVTAAPQWTDTERGLEIGDCRAFGYVLRPFPEVKYVPLGKYIQPKSVIEEFGA
ncbi:hydantoinase [Dacryopinax primogenitus]|uniref:Hydantoinase n=1 Tax=Dacryopinax primogenitus (strain DJM 731) TaxID=1858805 RepID=M5G461_DACPD|nr:hydantoinase [Dacryopinax primogenitus]EJT98542.1 hydantoinase [Dacryopinax primogenitus]